jgi:DnaJ-class molecular chaperone
MPVKNYYWILGVPVSGGPERVRAAFRDLVKQHHPDRSGESTGRFRDVVEAYETLSDPNRRRAYNRRLREAEQHGQPRPAWPAPEPLTPGPVSLFRDFGAAGPSFAELHDRFTRNFEPWRIPKGDRPEALDVEIVLTPEEARRGGILPIGLPVLRACPTCAGSGIDWPFPCRTCWRRGRNPTEEPIAVRVPPFVQSGTMFELALASLGVQNLVLRVHLFVS